MAGFSSNDCSAINRTISTVSSKHSDQIDVVVQYELRRCETWISTNGYQKVCLQFPDDILSDAPVVAQYLRLNTAAGIFVLADTSYTR